MADVGRPWGLLCELLRGLVGAAEIQLEGSGWRDVLWERLDDVGAEKAVRDGASKRIGEQGGAEQLDALRGLRGSGKAESKTEA